MKFFRAYIITLVIGILVALLLTINAKDAGSTLTNAKQKSYNDNWTVISHAGRVAYETLPDSIPREGKEIIILEKELPKEIREGDAVAFYSGHNVIHAYVEQKLVYSFEVPETYQRMSKTPGTTWSFINLSPADAGKILTIRLEPVYQGETENIPDMIYGDRAKIVVEIIAQRAGALAVSALLFSVGVAILLCMIFFQKQLRVPDFMYWLGVFAVIVACWSFMQTQLLSLIYAQNVQESHISFLIFQILLLPFISYVKNFYRVEKDDIYDTLCILNIILVAATTLLQFTGLQDYRETIWMTYGLYLFSALWVFITAVKALRRTDIEHKTVIEEGMSLMVLMTCVAIDMVKYLRAESVDSARLSRVVLLIYLIIQICLVFEDSIKLIHLGEQFEEVAEEALRDALTKLSNRTAFERDIEECPAEDALSVAIFDLNNLKYFNDVHGHATGDYYIIVCSEIIQDVFGIYGTVYRIGGDEFCAVTTNVDEEKFMELRRNMNDRIEALNGQFFENKMSVASGHAVFDAKLDESVRDTVKRADTKMYECKTAMKQRG